MRLSLFIFILTTTPLLAAESALTRDEAFRKIQSEAIAQSILEEASADLEAKRYEEALAKLDAVPAEQIESDPALLNARGAVLVQLGRDDDARAVFSRVLQIDPNFFPARFNQGEVLFQEGKFDEAAAHFLGMTQQSGTNPLLKFKLFLSYLLAGNDLRANTTLRDIRFPLDGPAWYFAQAAEKLQSGDTAAGRKLAKTGRIIHDDSSPYVESLQDAGLMKN